LAKTEERVHRKNFEFHEGNPHPTSLLYINKDIAINYLQQIGLNIGEISEDKGNNFHTLMDIEWEREQLSLGGLTKIG
jgi:hypothetical protein